MLDRSITLICGPQGSGKTDLLINTILPELPAYRYCLDPMHEYDLGVIYTGENDPTGRGNPARELVHMLENSSKARDHETHVVRPSHERRALWQGQMYDFAEVVNVGKLPGSVIFDETDLISQAGRAIDPVEDMLLRGRHVPQTLVFTAKDPTNISKTIIRQAQVHICFRYGLEDLPDYYLKKFDNSSILPHLSEHEFVVGGRTDLLDQIPYTQALEQAAHRETGEKLWTKSSPTG